MLEKLAWYLLKFHANLVSSLKKVVASKAFLARHRRSPQDFTRDRILSFPHLLSFLINLVKGSLQDELDRFFQVLMDRTVPVRQMTKAALCKARKKLCPDAFVELNDKLNAHFYRGPSSKRWKGFRVLAIDGSTCKVPNTPDVADHFGVWHSATGDPCPVARLSHLFDVLNHVTVHALIRSKKDGERVLAAEQVRQAGKGDLILLDRGYPAFWLFALIRFVGAQFCCRMVETTWEVIDEFVKSGSKDRIVTLMPSPTSIKQCENLGLPVKPIRIRLIKVELDTGEYEILATSLTDPNRYLTKIFGDLYHLRWGIEEAYKVWKQRIQIERWSGKSVATVLQDFHAKVFTANLTAVLANSVQHEVDKRTEHCKHPYAVNFTQALSKMKDTIVRLFTHRNPFQILVEFLDVLARTVEPVRPGRHYPRRFKVAATIMNPTYKPIR